MDGPVCDFYSTQIGNIRHVGDRPNVRYVHEGYLLRDGDVRIRFGRTLEDADGRHGAPAAVSAHAGAEEASRE